jgi:hypothetical protein
MKKSTQIKMRRFLESVCGLFMTAGNEIHTCDNGKHIFFAELYAQAREILDETESRLSLLKKEGG